MRLAQINSEQVQNNGLCKLVWFELITFKTTSSEGFWNSLTTFNIDEVYIPLREIHYPHTASKYPVESTVIFVYENCGLVVQLIISSCWRKKLQPKLWFKLWPNIAPKCSAVHYTWKLKNIHQGNKDSKPQRMHSEKSTSISLLENYL